jgi:hypothetical protein
MLLIGIKSELHEANTINKIFDLLSCNCASFLNFRVFQNLAKTFGIKESDKFPMNYHKKLEEYIDLHKIEEFIKINPALKGNRAKSGVELVLKFDIDLTCKLARITDLRKAVAKILDLQESTLQVVDITEGCVMVTFLIPTEIRDIIFVDDRQFTQEAIEDFRASSVKWLECNGHRYNFSKDSVRGVKTGKKNNLFAWRY